MCELAQSFLILSFRGPSPRSLHHRLAVRLRAPPVNTRTEHPSLALVSARLTAGAIDQRLDAQNCCIY